MPAVTAVASLTPEAVSRFLVGGFMEVLRSWMEDPDCDRSARQGHRGTGNRQRTARPSHDSKGLPTWAKHSAPERHPARDRAAIRTMVLAMVGLTSFVIAMIASYSGAFANPTLHHMTVAVAGPEQLVEGIRSQDSLAVTEVGDDAAARQQVHERRTDAAFVVAPGGEMKIYTAGGGGKSVATAAETVGRNHRCQGRADRHRGGRRADVGGRSVRHRRVLRDHLHLDRRSVGATLFGRIMGRCASR